MGVDISTYVRAVKYGRLARVEYRTYRKVHGYQVAVRHPRLGVQHHF